MLGIAVAICLGGRESSVTLFPRAISSPAPPATLVPQLTRLSHGRVVLSWQERLKEGGYRFAFAIRDAKGWSVARTIASGPNLSMFTADLPGIAELPDGALLAYWELKDMRDGDRYATAIQTAVSRDAAERGRGQSNRTRMPCLGSIVFSPGFIQQMAWGWCGWMLSSEV